MLKGLLLLWLADSTPSQVSQLPALISHDRDSSFYARKPRPLSTQTSYQSTNPRQSTKHQLKYTYLTAAVLDAVTTCTAYAHTHKIRPCSSSRAPQTGQSGLKQDNALMAVRGTRRWGAARDVLSVAATQPHQRRTQAREPAYSKQWPGGVSSSGSGAFRDTSRASVPNIISCMNPLFA